MTDPATPLDHSATDQPATDQPATDQPASDQPASNQPAPAKSGQPREIGGRAGLDPTRYGDWEIRGRCIDF